MELFHSFFLVAEYSTVLIYYNVTNQLFTLSRDLSIKIIDSLKVRIHIMK